MLDPCPTNWHTPFSRVMVSPMPGGSRTTGFPSGARPRFGSSRPRRDDPTVSGSGRGEVGHDALWSSLASSPDSYSGGRGFESRQRHEERRRMPAHAESIYDAQYRRRRDAMVAWALSWPQLARCWQCNQPLATCGPNRNGRHRNGTRAHWTAGHVRDGDRTSPLELECSPCNYRRGAEHGNSHRRERVGWFGRT